MDRHDAAAGQDSDVWITRTHRVGVVDPVHVDVDNINPCLNGFPGAYALRLPIIITIWSIIRFGYRLVLATLYGIVMNPLASSLHMTGRVMQMQQTAQLDAVRMGEG